MEDRLRPVFGLDDRVGLGQPLLQVAPLVVRGLVDQGAAPHGLVGIEERLDDVPLDVDELERGARLAQTCPPRRRPRLRPDTPARP